VNAFQQSVADALAEPVDPASACVIPAALSDNRSPDAIRTMRGALSGKGLASRRAVGILMYLKVNGTMAVTASTN
jgi:hypothetical protein